MAEAGGEHRAGDMAERGGTLHLLPQRHRVGRLGAVHVEVKRRVQPLPRVLDALAIALGHHRLFEQLVGHRLATRADLAHQPEHAAVVDPALEHLRWRLDEVTQHPGLRRVTRGRQVVVHRMAELVQQGLHLVERQAFAVEVDHQRRLRRALQALRATAQRPHRSVVVLAFPRVQVDIQRGPRLAARAVADGVGLGVGVP